MSSPARAVHEPVMVPEVLDLLPPDGADHLLDGTVGAGGHSEAFLRHRGGSSRVVGLDRDPEMLEAARRRLAPFGDRVVLVHRSYAELEAVLDDLGIATVDAALLDLGAASVHFDRPERGFSLKSPGPLDMRFDPSGGETAAELLDRLSEAELAELLREYGDERNARRVARAIVDARPVRDTLRLAETVERAVGGRGRIHPATRVFQALRMAVNRELDHLARGVPAAIRRLRPGGRFLAISFHSGEDGLVKRLLREEAKAGRVAPLTKKPVRPAADEVRRNPRARSARLRAVEREARGREAGPPRKGTGVRE